MVTFSNKMTARDEEAQTNQNIRLTLQIVIDTLSERIKSGGYVADTRPPFERAFANELGVSRNTVREALDYLKGRISSPTAQEVAVLSRIGPKLNKAQRLATSPNRQVLWIIF